MDFAALPYLYYAEFVAVLFFLAAFFGCLLGIKYGVRLSGLFKHHVTEAFEASPGKFPLVAGWYWTWRDADLLQPNPENPSGWVMSKWDGEDWTLEDGTVHSQPVPFKFI